MKQNEKKKLNKTDFVLIFFASLCIFLAIVPYSQYKSLADSLAADGNTERLTYQLVIIFKIVFIILSTIFIGLVLWHVFSENGRKRFFLSLAALPGRCIHDIRPFFRDLAFSLKPKDYRFWIFSAIFLSGIIIRFLRLNSPLMHDEAYSMAIWGRSDLFFAVSDYHLPNNHVFHSVLVNLIYHHIGKTVPLLRLPVFISGCLLIPAVWLLGRLFYHEVTGLIAAGFTAFAPFLIFYSHNARGYEIQAFLTVLTVGLVVYAKRKRNLFSWVLLILFSALNFFTLPIALYPFGGICVWLFLNVVFYKKNNIWRNRLQMLKYLVFMGISVSILSMLLYVPLLSVSGWDSFFGNIYIGGTEAATFGETMISRVKDNLQAFTESWPLFVNLFIGIGLILSLFSFRKNSKESLSFGLALFIWMGLLIPIQRPNLWPRTLLFLHPFLLLFASSGLSVLIKNKQMKNSAVCIYACLILTAGISQMTVISETGPDERAVRMIVEREGKNASNIHFVTAAQDNAPIWIYADAYNLSRKIFDKRESFNTIYALVNPLNDAYNGPKTLDDLMDRFGPGKNFIDWNSSQILMDEPDAILYRFEGKENAIRKAYGDFPEIKK